MPQPNQATDTGLTDTAGETSMSDFGEDGLDQSVLDQSGLTLAQQVALSQALGQHGQLHRPLLLEEQPLLLQDLLDQERQEQQQQRQMQAMIRQRSSDSFFPNIGKALGPQLVVMGMFEIRCVLRVHYFSFSDFDAITDPIMKAKMVALKGINKVMVQNNMGMAPMVMNR